ncbi:MAG: diguanylate cyclase domain protein [Firmicutes bacterium]|nr:diguanylate cyclase domain protein [Bacillota bacterium]
MSKVMSLFTTIPFGLLVAVGVTYSWLITNYRLSAPAVDVFIYAIYGIGLGMSWWFNRSRVFFVTVLLALCHFAISSQAAMISGIPSVPMTLYPVVSVLLPINIYVFSLLKERGIFTVWGLGRFGLIGCQLFYISLAIVANDPTLLSFFANEALPEGKNTAWVFSPMAILAYLAVFLLFFRKQFENYTALGNSFMAVLAATMAGLYFAKDAPTGSVFFGAAGIMLILAVIQDSYAMAYLDELTGLPARRAMKEELMKLRSEYTIAMVDIDFFKKFNDTYGHDTGDEVLRLVASVLKKVEGGGKAFRYGGEEFAIIFPYTTSEAALPALEKLRVAVSKTPYAYCKRQEKKTNDKDKDKTKKKPAVKQLSVTISIGVAERSEKYNQPDEVMKAADTALYRAKEKGRNCVSK